MTGGNGYQRQVDEFRQETEQVKVITAERETERNTKWFGDTFKVIVLGIIVFSCAIVIGLIADIYSQRLRDTNIEVVVTDAVQCTEIATDVMKKKNGNAVDALVAATLCLAVVKPDQFSLAGGGMMLLGNRQENVAIDMLYTLPSSSSFKHLNSTHAAVPNLLRGLMYAHKKYGRISWAKVLSPSISLANMGFVVSNSTGENINKFFPVLSKEFQRLFTANGFIIKSGDRLKQGRLAMLLSDLTNSSEKLENDIIETVKVYGGIMTKKDFSAYKPIPMQSIVSSYQGYQVVSSSPKSSGVLAQSALSILERLTAKKNLSISYEHVIEVLKIVFSKVEPLVMARNETVYQSILKNMLSSGFATEQSDRIKNRIRVKLPTVSFQEPSQVSVVRAIISSNGEMASFIGSMGDVFGSKVVTNHGVILNNGLDSFRFKQKETAMKKAFTFVAPIMLYNKDCSDVRYMLSPSVDMQGVAAVTQVIVNLVKNNMAPSEALRMPRVYPNPFTGKLHLQSDRFLEFNLQNVHDFLESTYKNVSSSTNDIGSVMLACDQAGNACALTDGK